MAETPAVLSASERARSRAWRDALIVSHLFLVPPIAKEVASRLPATFLFEDLVACGELALIKAADRYIPGAAPFSAYARKWVRGAMLDSARGRNFINQARMKPLTEAREFVIPNVIETEIDEGRLRRRLAGAVDRLPHRMRTSILHIYGRDEPTFAAVGQRMGVTGPRVHQIKAQALRKLRAALLAG